MEERGRLNKREREGERDWIKEKEKEPVAGRILFLGPPQDGRGVGLIRVNLGYARD